MLKLSYMVINNKNADVIANIGIFNGFQRLHIKPSS